MNNQEVQRVGKGQKQETYKHFGFQIGENLTFGRSLASLDIFLALQVSSMTRYFHALNLFCGDIEYIDWRECY